MSLPAVSKHLKVLERSGLIARGREAQWRPCRLKAEPLKDAVDWLEHYRRHWEECFDRLDDYLQELQAKGKKRGGKNIAAATSNRAARFPTASTLPGDETNFPHSPNPRKNEMPHDQSQVEYPSDREMIFTRVFDAPRELVWQARTEPRHMAQCWGPRNFTNPVCELDVRPGGAYQIVMRSPEGVDYPIKGVYREVVEPERLVMTMDCSEQPDECTTA